MEVNFVKQSHNNLIVLILNLYFTSLEFFFSKDVFTSCSSKDTSVVENCKDSVGSKVIEKNFLRLDLS